MPDWQWLWCAEIEPFPSAALEQRHGHPNLGDMTAEDFAARAIAIGIPDVLVAGTPCQAFSVAGKRAGLQDARGNLTLTAILILDALDHAARLSGRPAVTFVWENVPGVLSDKTNAFGCLLAGLVGHDTALLAPQGANWPHAGMVRGPARWAAWRLLDAQYFGLAQRRARVFLVAGAGDGPDPAQVLFEPQGVRRHPPARGGEREGAAPTLAARTGGGGGPGTDAECGRDGVAGTLLANGKAAGSATQQDAETGMLIAAPTLQVAGTNLGNPAPQVLAYGSNNTSGAIDVAPALLAQPGSGWRGDFESETFIAGEVATTLRGRDLRRGVDSDCTDTIIAHTLRGEGFDASEDGTGRGTPLVAGALTNRIDRGGVNSEGADGHIAPIRDAVRRLTPTECERLQGFPDGFTLVTHRGKPAADGPRYKALGNSMAVPVLRWILSRLELATTAKRRDSIMLP